MVSRSLDRIDKLLLEELQLDASRTNDELAERIGLSPSAASRRLQRLHNAKVIERTIAIVDPLTAGSRALLVVGIEVERERPELVEPLRRWLRRESWVQQAYYVTGSADYVLVVSAPDIGAFDEFMTRMMIDNPNVRRFTTNVTMTVIKHGLFVPVD
ncbi:Lrp/AsnC family transcriptional regulator [Sphingomonas sp.]|uniref:Lrp/AsnC family transcriptional regulator n=1 Tax=Sphingomonas sp. TaxID=28214 RepID=UPI0038A78AEA